MSESVLFPALQTLFTTNSLEEIGVFCSFYKAVVKEINTKEGLKHTIKVYCPTFHEANKTSDWIKPFGLSVGNQNGLYMMPKVNEEVLVICVNGDNNNLLWTHGFWKEGQTMKDVKPESYILENDLLRIELDREEKKIKLKTENINFELNQDSKKVKLEIDGYSLKNLLDETLDAIINMKISTALGAQPPINLATFVDIKNNKITKLFE